MCVELPEPPSPFIEGACTRGAELGEPCDERTPCGPFGRCVEGRCAEIVDPAGQCDALHVCPTTHDCVDGACVPGPLPGEACEGRRCGFTACRDGVCLAHDPGEGEPCWGEGYQCDFGLECGGDPAATTCRPPCP